MLTDWGDNSASRSSTPALRKGSPIILPLFSSNWPTLVQMPFLNWDALFRKVEHDGSVPAHTIFMRNFLLGGFSAAISVTLMAPVERIKLILQVQNASHHVNPQLHYKGMIDCLIRIPKEQGFRSFWRGNMASVYRSFPYQALNFAFRDRYKDIFVRHFDKKHHFWRRLGGNLLSGGIAGATSMSLIYPLDYARTRLAMDQSAHPLAREFRNISHCISETYKMDGVTGLYRGFHFSIFGVFVYRAGFFGLYDTGRDFTPDEHKHELLVSFLTAEFAAIISGLISYPMDTVRRSMMMQSARIEKKRHYSGSLDCIRKTYRHAGVRGFYNGAFVNIIRGTGGAIILVLYNDIHHRLWGHLGEGPSPEDIEMRKHKSCLPPRKPCMVCGVNEDISEVSPDTKPEHQISAETREQLSSLHENEYCPTRSFADHAFSSCDL